MMGDSDAVGDAAGHGDGDGDGDGDDDGGSDDTDRMPTVRVLRPASELIPCLRG